MLEKAKAILINGCYTCVMLDGESFFLSSDRGVKPLLDWLESRSDFSSYVAADKVVGKAAAFLYVILGVKAVYAIVLSRSAKEVFENHGIEIRYDTLVDAVRNRTDTGFCPMEQAVMNISSPVEAKNAVINKLRELNS